ncbi:MAG: pirin family protein [Labilithrix sp.]|nr:pirin family protein [Labilithrix sp.]MBX3214303.1 pirin family protein [Labilithrix sp.]
MAQATLSNPSTTLTFDRSIRQSVRGMQTSDGAGVKLTRVVGTPLLRRIDPFLMLDEFRSDEPQDYLAGFPDHPHRGFETITYMIAGRFRHRDNKGHEGILAAGGAQWMTAGRGIVHSEMPEQEEGLVHGFQLWLNLPRKDKMCEPSYRDLQSEDIPRVTLPGGSVVRVLGGAVGDVTGPISGRATEPVYLDVELARGDAADLPVPAGHEGFVYPFAGDVVVGRPGHERTLARGELGVLTPGDGVRLRAKDGSARALVVAGKPLGEPVVQYGPFVMTTPEEVEQAVRDFQAGRF